MSLAPMALTLSQNVSKGQLAQCIKSGVDTLDKLKAKTKAGTGCGGCK